MWCRGRLTVVERTRLTGKERYEESPSGSVYVGGCAGDGEYVGGAASPSALLVAPSSSGLPLPLKASAAKTLQKPGLMPGFLLQGWLEDTAVCTSVPEGIWKCAHRCETSSDVNGLFESNVMKGNRCGALTRRAR